jgi:hypothetical protein
LAGTDVKRCQAADGIAAGREVVVQRSNEARICADGVVAGTGAVLALSLPLIISIGVGAGAELASHLSLLVVPLVSSLANLAQVQYPYRHSHPYLWSSPGVVAGSIALIDG